MIEKKPMFDQDSDRKSITFPNVFPITMSHSELPTSRRFYSCVFDVGEFLV